MTFKDFIDKYLGMIIGIVVAVLIIVIGGDTIIAALMKIALIVGLGWLGKYLQGNKSTVKDRLKNWIDKM